jgi:hypothetical protein
LDKQFENVDPDTLLHKITIKIAIDDSLKLKIIKFFVDQIRSQLRKQPIHFHISIEGEDDSKEEHYSGLKSKLTEVRPGSPSLRATVPEGIVAFLDLKESDKLEWKMDIIGIDNERVAIVKKLEGEA